MERTRNPGQRAGLTRDQVLLAAGDLVRDEGLSGLSMRTLAHRLGVRPNTLYSHVSDKDDLVDSVLDEVLAKVSTPDPAVDDPLEGVHAMMSSSYDVLLEHADLVPTYLARQGSSGPRAQHLGEVTLGLLARAGVTGAQARQALRVLIVYTIGFAAFNPGAPFGDRVDPKLAAEDLRCSFERGLRWLIAGIAEDADGAGRT
jgi:TetR/AcrR family transcriptional regulator, tetracycline repressor protein